MTGIHLPILASGNPQQVLFYTPGTYTWYVPESVTKITVICVGGGGGSPGSIAPGGGGGALRYWNTISVTPGEACTVVVGQRGFGGYTNGSTTISPTNGGSSSFTCGAGTVTAGGGGAGLFIGGGLGGTGSGGTGGGSGGNGGPFFTGGGTSSGSGGGGQGTGLCGRGLQQGSPSDSIGRIRIPPRTSRRLPSP